MAMRQQDSGAAFGEVLGTRSEVRSDRGVVAAGHPLAVAAGLDALAAGGNAIDAVVAGAFAAFVAEPNNAGIAGYGHLSAHLAGRGFLTVDHGPRAPLAARADMFATVPGEPEGHDWPDVEGDRNSVGGLAVAVPGAVAGLWAAHERAGRLPWRRLLEPAIAAAEEGLEVRWGLALELAAAAAELAARPALAAILTPAGRLPRARNADAAGERLWQRPLAATLALIADQGPRAFYDGPVAESIVAAVRGAGGVMTREDLAGYEAKVLAETPARYRGLDYVTANDQVGYEALGILEALPPLGGFAPAGAEHLHLLAEAMGHAFADNATWYGDPDHTASPVGGLAAREFAALRAGAIRLDRAAPRPVAAGDPWPFEQRGAAAAVAVAAPPGPSAGGAHGTTQVVAGDADGNLVALITTIGGDFGALVADPQTGVLLNNSMRNYDPRPGRSNSIAPRKMPFFAVPAIVAAEPGGDARFAAGGSGGYPILAGVLCTFCAVVDFGLGVQAAIDLPRVHSQGGRTFIDARVDAAERERLEALGHELVVAQTTPGELPFARVGAVTRGADGDLRAGCGPAWSMAAGGL